MFYVKLFDGDILEKYKKALSSLLCNQVQTIIKIKQRKLEICMRDLSIVKEIALYSKATEESRNT